MKDDHEKQTLELNERISELLRQNVVIQKSEAAAVSDVRAAKEELRLADAKCSALANEVDRLRRLMQEQVWRM